MDKRKTTWADVAIRALDIAASGWGPLARICILLAVAGAVLWLARGH